MKLVFLFATAIIVSVNGGINWGCCLGYCPCRTPVEEIPSRRQNRQDASVTFTDLNTTMSPRDGPVYRGRAWTAPRRDPKARYTPPQSKEDATKRDTAISNYSCQSIVLDLPLSKSEQINDQLIQNCIRRWHELNGDLPPDSRYSSLPTDSRTTNLLILKIDGTILDSRKVPWKSTKPSAIPRFNKNDLIFNQLPSRHDVRSANLFRTLITYRKGLMQLFHTLKSGKIKRNYFDVALIGDLNFDSVFNAVAMETYFNQHYLRIVERHLFQLQTDLIQQLQLNFVSAQRMIPETLLSQYQRVIIVRSKLVHVRIPAKVLATSQILQIKISPFLMISRWKSNESVLKDMYNQRELGDNALDKLSAILSNKNVTHPLG